MKANLNDKVSARKFVYDRYYYMTGTVIGVGSDTLKIEDAAGQVDYYGTDDEIQVVETELSRKYNTTPERIASENMNFVQSEGYFETANKTIECKTFAQWLELALRKPEYRTTEPWQKSDLGYGL